MWSLSALLALCVVKLLDRQHLHTKDIGRCEALMYPEGVLLTLCVGEPVNCRFYAQRASMKILEWMSDIYLLMLTLMGQPSHGLHVVCILEKMTADYLDLIIYTENWESSWCQLVISHWQHVLFSWQQPPGNIIMRKLASEQLLVSS